MRVSKFAPFAFLATLCFAPMPAVADPAYACSVAEIFECTAVAGCQRIMLMPVMDEIEQITRFHDRVRPLLA